MYVLSGASVTFYAFGATHVQINPASTPMQVFAGIGLISIGLGYLLARKFELNNNTRNHGNNQNQP